MKQFKILLLASMVILFTACDEGSSADTMAPIITLNGENNITLLEGEIYTDLGSTATDNVDATVTVTSSGIVDTNKVGTYTITYSAKDKAGNKATPKIRTVHVLTTELSFFIKNSSPYLGTFNIGGYDDAEAVTLSSDGTKAYLVSYNEGLQIIDISNPVSPVLISTFDTTGAETAVTLSNDGTKAYVTSYSEGSLDDTEALVIISDRLVLLHYRLYLSSTPNLPGLPLY